MDLLLELLHTNVEIIVGLLLSVIVALMGKLAKKTDTNIDDKIAELVKDNEAKIKTEATKLAKKKLAEALEKRKKDK